MSEPRIWASCIRGLHSECPCVWISGEDPLTYGGCACSCHVVHDVMRCRNCGEPWIRVGKDVFALQIGDDGMAVELKLGPGEILIYSTCDCQAPPVAQL